MEMAVCAVVISLVCFARAIYLKIYYMTHYATFLEYRKAHGAFTTYPLYEYELIENDQKVLYRNRGIAIGHLRAGKRQKVLIHKENHNKIMAYNQFICTICEGIFFALNAMMLFAAWHM